jgi:hypothetical protein
VPKYGLVGTGYCKCIHEVIGFVLLVWYSRISDSIDSSPNFGGEVQSGLGRYVREGMKCTPMIMLERWSGAALMLACGTLGPDITAAFNLDA